MPRGGILAIGSSMPGNDAKQKGLRLKNKKMEDKNMITEIKSVEINETEIVLEGINLESILTAENLYEEMEEETVRFVFDRQEHGVASLKYLWKVCESQKKCKGARSMGEKLEKLVGCILSLSENFIER